MNRLSLVRSFPLIAVLVPGTCSPERSTVPKTVEGPAASDRFEVIATLVSLNASAPGCGVLHVGVVMRYEVFVPEAHHAGGPLYVVHGCPEMPRSEYGRDAGSLRAFIPGERHRLLLEKQPPTRSATDPEVIVDEFEDTDLPRYRALRADPVPP